jgi:hypothetical protein
MAALDGHVIDHGHRADYARGLYTGFCWLLASHVWTIGTNVLEHTIILFDLRGRADCYHVILCNKLRPGFDLALQASGSLRRWTTSPVKILSLSFAILSSGFHASDSEQARSDGRWIGGGARQTISGRGLAPYMVDDNNIPSWIHMDYIF